MLRTLLTPRWLGGLLVAALFAAASLALGFWQYGKHEERLEWRDLVESHLDADPVEPGTVWGDGAVADDEQWIPVRVTGQYLPEHQQLVRNRPHFGVFGYEVLVPLRASDGSQVLVNRGWVPNAPSADLLPEVPPAPGPDEDVEVVGWARRSEVDLDRSLPEGQVASINAPLVADLTGLDLIDGYLVLQSETLPPDGATPPRPEVLEAPRTELGPHFAYALQWWLTAPLGFVLVVVFARREYRDSIGTNVARPRKHRIWDDEDE